MLFGRFFRSKAMDEQAASLYLKAVAQSRLPIFYLDCGVPDTPEGRFDMIALHVYLLLRRLRTERDRTGGLAQAVFDLLFADMDRNLREMGIGDMGVGKRIKAMARAFYGRIAAYDAGLDGEAGVLEAAIRRNLYGTVSPNEAHVAAMANYTRSQMAALNALSIEGLLGAQVLFSGPLP